MDLVSTRRRRQPAVLGRHKVGPYMIQHSGKKLDSTLGQVFGGRLDARIDAPFVTNIVTVVTESRRFCSQNAPQETRSQG